MIKRKIAVDPDGFEHYCGLPTNSFTHAVLVLRKYGQAGWRLETKTRTKASADRYAARIARWRSLPPGEVAVVEIVVKGAR